MLVTIDYFQDSQIAAEKDNSRLMYADYEDQIKKLKNQLKLQVYYIETL
jgi:hypothetical protein